MFKGLLLSLFVLVGLFLFSNIDKGIEIVSPDQVLIHPLTNVPLKSVLSSYPDTKIVSLQEEIVQVPYGKVDEYLTRFQNDPKIQSSSPVSIPATFDFSKYAVELEKQAVLYAHGDMGAIEFHKVIVPIGPKIGQLILNSLSYLIPGLFLGILSGYMIAVLATWKPKIGQVLDKFHQLLLGIPDFFVLVLLQLAAIQLAKSTGHKVLTVFQFGDDVPFLIPLISISLLPGVLLYGTLRLAVEREWDAPYISTAYSKGIQRTKILFIHILRNTTADVLSILPRVIAVGITSLVVAEVMSGIFGLGGYALNPDITKVTSLGVTCAIFALFALVMHFLISWFGQTFTFKHEGGTLTNRPQLFKKRDRFRFQFSFVLLLLLTFVVVFGSHLMPHHITKDAMLQFQNLTVNGQVKIVSPPFPPSSTFWLGTDHRGYDILSLLLNGAKYTFGFALIVTVLRFAVALPIGLIVGYSGRGKKVISTMQLITAAVPTLLFLYPALYVLYNLLSTSEDSPSNRLFISITILLLVFFGIFQLAHQFAERAAHISGSLFILAAKTMGASKSRMIFRHLLPLLRSEVLFAFVTEYLQVIFLVGQLAILNIFIGGGEVFPVAPGYNLSVTTIGEWGGMITYGTRVLRYFPWIILSVGAFYLVAILILLFFSRQLQKFLSQPIMVRKQTTQNKTFWSFGGLVVAVAIMLVIFVPSKAPITVSSPPSSGTTEQQSQTQSAVPESKKQDLLKLAKMFMGYIQQGDLDTAQTLLTSLSAKEPSITPFDEWAHACSKQGYKFVDVKDITSTKELEVYRVTIVLTDGSGKPIEWQLNMTTYGIISGKGTVTP